MRAAGSTRSPTPTRRARPPFPATVRNCALFPRHTGSEYRTRINVICRLDTYCAARGARRARSWRTPPERGAMHARIASGPSAAPVCSRGWRTRAQAQACMPARRERRRRTLCRTGATRPKLHSLTKPVDRPCRAARARAPQLAGLAPPPSFHSGLACLPARGGALQPSPGAKRWTAGTAVLREKRIVNVSCKRGLAILVSGDVGCTRAETCDAMCWQHLDQCGTARCTRIRDLVSTQLCTAHRSPSQQR